MKKITLPSFRPSHLKQIHLLLYLQEGNSTMQSYHDNWHGKVRYKTYFEIWVADNFRSNISLASGLI